MDSAMTLSFVRNVLCDQGAIKNSNPDKLEAAEGTFSKN